mmetsp:Transcript_15516/g.41874  ORF Transcript_15516/g.41874 Transcript_15516/m.41874 type:complete len:208 (-) Transcript_15516:13-636(-)
MGKPSSTSLSSSTSMKVFLTLTAGVSKGEEPGGVSEASLPREEEEVRCWWWTWKVSDELGFTYITSPAGVSSPPAEASSSSRNEARIEAASAERCGAGPAGLLRVACNVGHVFTATIGMPSSSSSSLSLTSMKVFLTLTCPASGSACSLPKSTFPAAPAPPRSFRLSTLPGKQHGLEPPDDGVAVAMLLLLKPASAIVGTTGARALA